MPPGGGGAPPPPGIPPGPAAAPMAQPTENAGAVQAGAAEVESCQSVLAQALTKMSPKSPQYEAIVKSLGILAKAFGEQQAQDLVPAQIMQLAQAQQSNPLMQVLAQQGAAGGGGPPPGAT